MTLLCAILAHLPPWLEDKIVGAHFLHERGQKPTYQYGLSAQSSVLLGNLRKPVYPWSDKNNQGKFRTVKQNSPEVGYDGQWNKSSILTGKRGEQYVGEATKNVRRRLCSRTGSLP